MHEFGHALACRQVGGKADRIMLWPLGGVAFVQPPPRPGALLWSIAAGPLVNVVLVPFTAMAVVFASLAGWNDVYPDLAHFLFSIALINLGLLVFNLLATAFTNRGLVESRLGRWQQAIADYDQALQLQPKLAAAHNNLAWLLATCPVDALRDGQVALEHATWACKATGWTVPNFLGTLAAAYAEVGDFGRALHWHQRALADPGYRQTYGDEAEARLRLYEQGVPCRLPQQGG